MNEEQKICTHCEKDISNRKRIVQFINIEQGSPYYFCSQKCKKAWLSERIGKSQIDGVEWSRDTPIKKKLFNEAGNLKTKGEKKAHCKYCSSEWKSDRSKIQHERWCDENPNKRAYRDAPVKAVDKTEKKKLLIVHYPDKDGNDCILGTEEKSPEPKGILPKGDDFMAEDDGEKDITVKDLIVLGLDTKNLIKEFQRFFRNKEAILKSIDKLVERWEKEDSVL